MLISTRRPSLTKVKDLTIFFSIFWSFHTKLQFTKNLPLNLRSTTQLICGSQDTKYRPSTGLHTFVLCILCRVEKWPLRPLYYTHCKLYPQLPFFFKLSVPSPLLVKFIFGSSLFPSYEPLNTVLHSSLYLLFPRYFFRERKQRIPTTLCNGVCTTELCCM